MLMSPLRACKSGPSIEDKQMKSPTKSTRKVVRASQPYECYRFLVPQSITVEFSFECKYEKIRGSEPLVLATRLIVTTQKEPELV